VLGRQRNRAAGAPPQARAVGERGPGGCWKRARRRQAAMRKI
jgi:hypothetical protein